MKAAVLTAFGKPDVIEVAETPDPRPRRGWTVVELRAAALNWHDVIIRRRRADRATAHHGRRRGRGAA
jgi:zinc-binding alcohol dehydrogenase/oxidoreductase